MIEPHYIITGQDVLMRICPNHDFPISDQPGVEIEWKNPTDNDWQRGITIPLEDIRWVIEALDRARRDQERFDEP